MIRSIHSALKKKRQKLHKLASVGEGCLVMSSARFCFHDKISIGNYVRIGHECYLNGEGGVVIEDGVVLAACVTILSSTHCYQQRDFLPFNQNDEFRSVTIKAGAWIGYGAMIAPGATIGEGSIVAMGAVVAGDVGKGHVVGGNPARVIKERDSQWIDEQVSQSNYFTRAVVEKRVKRR